MVCFFAELSLEVGLIYHIPVWTYHNTFYVLSKVIIFQKWTLIRLTHYITYLHQPDTTCVGRDCIFWFLMMNTFTLLNAVIFDTVPNGDRSRSTLECTDLRSTDLGFLLWSLSSNGDRFRCTARRLSFLRLFCLLSPNGDRSRSDECTDLRSTDLGFLLCSLSSNGDRFQCTARRSSFWRLFRLLSPNGDRSRSVECIVLTCDRPISGSCFVYLACWLVHQKWMQQSIGKRSSSKQKVSSSSALNIVCSCPIFEILNAFLPPCRRAGPWNVFARPAPNQ